MDETKRVLHKNGILAIMACPPPLISEAIWFAQIHPTITDKLSKLTPTVKQYIALLNNHGFKCLSAVNLLPTTTSMYGSSLNPEGPLYEDWRTGTSMFELAGPKKENEKFLI